MRGAPLRGRATGFAGLLYGIAASGCVAGVANRTVVSVERVLQDYGAQEVGTNELGQPEYAFLGWFNAQNQFELYKSEADLKLGLQSGSGTCLSGRLNMFLTAYRDDYSAAVRNLKPFDGRRVRMVASFEVWEESIRIEGGRPLVSNYCESSIILYASKVEPA
jgi:hypothetical protein